MKAFVSGRKKLTLRCGSSFAKSFILKGGKPEVEVIIVRKQPLLVFHVKVIKKAKNHVAKLTSENYQLKMIFYISS